MILYEYSSEHVLCVFFILLALISSSAYLTSTLFLLKVNNTMTKTSFVDLIDFISLFEIKFFYNQIEYRDRF